MKKRWLLLLLVLFSFNFAYPDTVNDILSERNFKAGVIRFGNREYEAAIQLFTKSVSLNPMNFQSRYYLGQAYLNSGYPRNAIEEWENLLKLGGGNYQVKQKLNDLYFRLSIDKSYDYSSPYIFSRLFNGITNGMSKIDRPSFIVYDENTDSLLVSSTKTKYVVEIDGSYKVVRQIGRKFGDYSSFKTPMGICLYNNTLYVADYSQDCIFVFQRDGKYINKFGSRGFSVSNIAGPMGIAISGDEYLYVVDNGNDRIQKFDLHGEWIQSIGEGELKRPTDVAIQNNILYVSDTMNKRVVAYDGFGNVIEVIGEEQLQEPRGLQVRNNLLYIVDGKLGLYVYDLSNKSLEKFGTGDDKIKYPFGVCLDSKNILHLTDFNTQNIAVYMPLQLQYANLGVQVNQIRLAKYPQNAIHIRVWDKSGKPVFHLKEGNITILEEGTEIPLPRLGATYEYRENMYVKLIIDRSRPMQEKEEELTEILRTFLKNTLKNDWLDIMIVNDKPESSGKIQASELWPVDYIKKHPFVSAYPENLDKTIHEAIFGLLNVNRNKAIVLMTSGETGPATFGDYDADMLLTYAKQNAIPIYVINFSGNNKDIFQRLAEETFGRYYTLREIKEINKLYDTIRNSPPLEYIVSYEGLNLRGMRNFWVNVHIKVKYKDLVGVDDTGYFVPEFTSEKSFFNIGGGESKGH